MLIKNHIIPFSGFIAMNVLGIIFIRNKDWEEIDDTFKEQILNHERIHTKQMLELLVIGFYLIYLIEWVFKGYDNISFEKEAYLNETNLNYLKTRKHYAQWKH